eukprot:TRINITY_DN11841_c0_g1_i1.p1 TRINITY_DN11841_c0_g1~~TRINITY_DN11841_c0_g1_i1.p1  ORF type:complete len:329 (-),score=40.94 TRINITY_DN11841_c0_g1_i1:15-1001(-)
MVYCAGSSSQAKGEQDFMECMKRHKLDFDSSWWDKEQCSNEVKSRDYMGGVYQTMAAKFWPSKFVHWVANHAVQKGNVSFYFNTEVKQIVPTCKKPEDVVADRYILHVDDGSEVQLPCNIVIHATNGWASRLFPDGYFLTDHIITPTRGQVVLTSPVYPNTIKPNFASGSDGFIYMIQRNCDGRLLLGGSNLQCLQQESRVTLDDSVVSELVSNYLHDWMKTVLTELPGNTSNSTNKVVIEKEWTGIMGFSRDHRPLIGPLPPFPNEATPHDNEKTPAQYRHGQYIAAGYTGDGMSMAFAAGNALAEMICGKLHPDRFIACFNPARFL